MTKLKIIKSREKLYDFDENERKEKRLKKISFLDRIRFIKFKNKTKDENSEVNLQKIKEVRLISYGGCACRNWIY